MSKKAKTAVIAIVCVVVCVGVIVGTMAGVAQKAKDDTACTSFLSSWMGFIKDDVLLTNTVIPGAHDAGSVSMMWAAETQDKSIGQMLECGVRYFDVRVEKKKDKLVIFHGPITGVEFAPIIDDVSEFLTSNPSETVLLDFQHFNGDGVMQAVYDVLSTKLEGKTVANDTEADDLTFIKSLTLGDVRGKALVLWGNFFGDNSVCDFVKEHNDVFQRNNDSGNRGGSVLQSYYEGKLNKQTSKKYIETAIPKYVEKYKNGNGGLFVMQMQLTDPIAIVGPKFLESTHDKNASEFVKNLPNADYFDCVNIIMRDYLGARKSKEIIALNIAKNNVEQTKIALFEQETA